MRIHDRQPTPARKAPRGRFAIGAVPQRSLLHAALLLAIMACVCTFNSRAVAGDECDQLAGLITDRMVVRMNEGVEVSQFIAAVEANNPDLTAAPLESIPNRPIHLLEVDLPDEWGPVEFDAFENQLKSQYTGLVAWAEMLYDAEAPEGKTGDTFLDDLILPTEFAEQYAVEKLGLPVAHQRSTGVGVVVAVLDTGVDASHPLFENGIAPGGYDFVEGDDDPNDDGEGIMVGHGTYVAGLVRLVAPEAKILPLRVLNPEGKGDLWTLAQGMFYAIDRGVEVINVSIASTYKSEAVEDAVDEAKDLGIVVTAAAGNCNQDKPREFPAMQSNVFGSAALDHNDIKADFSNYNDKLFISAPGNLAFLQGNDVPDPTKSMISALPSTLAGEQGNYAYWKGTSMSAPLVAGAVALIRAQHPEWTASEQTWDLIEGIVEQTAADIEDLNPQYEEELGVGRIDAAAATLTGPVQPTLGDFDHSGSVGVPDLLTLLGDWGLVHSSADLNGDGSVGVPDLLILLSNWG